jgi:hypothetical protein
LQYNKQGDVYGPSLYTDYVRVYAPANSRLISGWGFSTNGPSARTSDEPGLAMWGGLVKINPSQTKVITLSWYVPNAAAPGKVVAAGQAPYSLLVQRQSGTFNNLKVTITPAAAAATTQGAQPVSFTGVQGANQVISLPPPA